MARPPIPRDAVKAMRHRATVEISEETGKAIAASILGPDSASRITGGRLYLETLKPLGNESPTASIFAEDEERMLALGKIASASTGSTRAVFPADGGAPSEEGGAA